MRFMIIVKANKETEAGVMPTEKLLADMGQYNEDLLKAGILLDGAGLKPSSAGARIRYAPNGNTTVIDGPFSETKELIAGYAVIQARSKAEAIEWARRMPNPAGDGKEAEIEVRQFYEIEDFGPSDAIDRYRDTGFSLPKK